MKCIECKHIAVDTSGCFDKILCRIKGYVDPDAGCEIWDAEHMPCDADGQMFLFKTEKNAGNGSPAP